MTWVTSVSVIVIEEKLNLLCWQEMSKVGVIPEV